MQTWTPERTGYPTQKPLAQYERVIKASSNAGDIVLDPRAGCATVPQLRFMELDHQLPRKDGGANHILNRILLCGPCNSAKSASLTLSGLAARNKKSGEMTDETIARLVTGPARDAARLCRVELGGA